MPDDNSRDAPDLERLIATLASFRQEKAGMAEQRKEIALLIKQASAEGERAAQIERDSTSQLRHLQTNLEAFPRADIQRRYAEVLERRLRLGTWRSQLEQLRSRQASIDRMEELLDQLLSVAEALLRLSVERETLPPSLPSHVTAHGSALAEAIPSIELANQRLSRRLQDSSAQPLSDLILRAEVCERLLEVDLQRAREEIRDLRAAAAAALQSTRRLVQEMQPPTLEEQGLASALQRYVGAFRSDDSLTVTLQISGEERRLPPSHEIALFRIVQEALANAAQHSGSDRAEVSLRFEPDRVIATVADLGRGFLVSPTLANSRQRINSGLADMQLRAGLVGATLEITSRPGSGCMVSLAIPR